MPNKPVVFIPGFIATKLKFRPTNWTLFPPNPLDLLDAQKKQQLVELLSSPKFDDPNDDVQPDEPIRNILGITQQADALYSLLTSHFGYDTSAESTDFRAVGWDWRKAVDDVQTQAAVVKAINDLFAATGKKVVLLPHSTGGLVMRKLLEDQPQLTDKIEQVISFGIPWAGALSAVLALDDPSKVGIGPLSLSAADVKRITTNAQAAYDLAPPNPAKTDMHLAGGVPLNFFIENGQQASPLVQNGWMSFPEFMLPMAQRAAARLGARTPAINLGGGHMMPPITNVCGWGIPSATQIDLLPNATLQFSASPLKLGDGTVPLYSAAWLRGPDIRTMVVPIGAYPVGNLPMRHSRIWDSLPVVQLLNEVLADAPRRPFVAASVDGDDFQDPAKPTFRLRISAADEHGDVLPNCTATFKYSTVNKPTIEMDTIWKEVTLPREGIKPNVNGTNFFRLPIQVKWKGGKTEIVVIFHTL